VSVPWIGRNDCAIATWRQTGAKRTVLLETSLAGVERPCHPATEGFITVTDDYEDFGSDLLASYPLEKVEAETPEQAAWDYACRHGLFPIRVVVNLSGCDREWMLDEGGVHEV
jgi:hypothetical protein